MNKPKIPIRELIKEQAWRCGLDNAVEAFIGSGALGGRLRELTDRQVGQLMFDYIGDDFAFGTSEAAICADAIQRLFRSSAGARAESEVLNLTDTLPDCPKCGEPMMHFVGIEEPDFWQCVSLKCGQKIEVGKND